MSIVTRPSWQKSARYRIGSWLVDLGQQLLRKAERREIASRIAVRLRREPKGPGYDRRSKDIAADEIMKFYVAKQKATESAEWLPSRALRTREMT